MGRNLKSLRKWFDKYKRNIIIRFIILYFIFITIYLLLLLGYKFLLKGDEDFAFDDADKSNMVQVGILAGAIMLGMEAKKLSRKTYKVEKKLYDLEVQENLPELFLYIRDSEKKGKRSKYFDWSFIYNKDKSKGKYLALRNVGKGAAYNILVTVLDSNSQGVNKTNISDYSSKSIAPGGDEIALKIKQSPFPSSKAFQNAQIKVEANTSLDKDKQRSRLFYKYSIQDVEKNHVLTLKKSHNEAEIGL